jgi:hypothetical protein
LPRRISVRKRRAKNVKNTIKNQSGNTMKREVGRMRLAAVRPSNSSLLQRFPSLESICHLARAKGASQKYSLPQEEDVGEDICGDKLRSSHGVFTFVKNIPFCTKRTRERI